MRRSNKTTPYFVNLKHKFVKKLISHQNLVNKSSNFQNLKEKRENYKNYLTVKAKKAKEMIYK